MPEEEPEDGRWDRRMPEQDLEEDERWEESELDSKPGVSYRWKKFNLDSEPDGGRWKGAAEEPDQEYPLYLTSMRVIDHWHTGTMTMKVPELRKANPAAFVEINPEDAERAGIAHDDMVVEETRRDSLTLPARVSDTCRPGLVAVPFFDATKLVNKLFLDATDPASREPEYKICAARIRKA